MPKPDVVNGGEASIVAMPPAEHAHWNWGLYWIGVALGVGLTLAAVDVFVGLGG